MQLLPSAFHRSPPNRADTRLARLGAGLLAGSFLVWSSVASAALPPDSFADLTEKVSPAVVFITSTQMAETSGAAHPTIPFQFPPGSPFEKFFKQFEGQLGQTPEQAPQPVTGIGSGFLIDSSGYVVTNNHVIDSAQNIEVKLNDGRTFPAKVIGSDPKTDLGLLKIESDVSLPYVGFGNSDEMRVGDWVLAVGNPYGLGGTVTAGIISARNRDINSGPYDDFLQTDAAINRGNSGGPMFNLKGEVIGVNTAIFSPNGGSIGIGFAIPSNIVKNVIAQLRDHGSVERGWLGVKIQELTPDLAAAMNLPKAKGALVAEVTQDSPAAHADLRQGDVILRFNDHEIDQMRDLPRLVADVPPGQTVAVELWRNGTEKQVDVTIARLTPQEMAAASPAPVAPGKVNSETLGATLSSLSDQDRQQLNLPETTTGVLITDLQPNGKAASQGLRVGDVITQVDGTRVTEPSAVDAHIAKAAQDNKKAVLLLVNRQGSEVFVGLKLGKA